MRKILILLLFLTLSLSAQAVGSRFVIEVAGTGVANGAGASVKVKIYQDDAKFNPSKAEDVDFKIRNPREGDRCETKTDKTNDNGEIEGVCYASKEGSYSVYVKSNDKGDESGDFVLNFYAPTPTITPTPTKEPTETPEPEEEDEQDSDFERATEDEEPTPTPEPEVAGFFSKPGNLIATIVGVLALLTLLGLLFKDKIKAFLNKSKKKEELKEIKPQADDVPSETEPEQPTSS